MQRIVVSSDSNPTLSNLDFIFPVNPSEYDPQDEANIAVFNTLHGNASTQLMSDNRIRIMRWKGFPVSNEDIQDIISYFRTNKGQIRHFHFRDLSDINERWPYGLSWRKARIVDIKTKPAPDGRLTYESVDLEIMPSD